MQSEIEKPNIRWVTADQKKMAQNRRDLVAKLYRRGYSYSQIGRLVATELGREKPFNKATISVDVKNLLSEWRKERLDDMDEATQLELQRIDEIIRECWEAWEKSKKDAEMSEKKRKGTPDGEGIKTMFVEEKVRDIAGYGDVRYLEMINKQLIERRKILGLYAPEKKELNGTIDFEEVLQEASIIVGQ